MEGDASGGREALDNTNGDRDQPLGGAHLASKGPDDVDSVSNLVGDPILVELGDIIQVAKFLGSIQGKGAYAAGGANDLLGMKGDTETSLMGVGLGLGDARLCLGTDLAYPKHRGFAGAPIGIDVIHCEPPSGSSFCNNLDSTRPSGVRCSPRSLEDGRSRPCSEGKKPGGNGDTRNSIKRK
ncbi:unnamed protein product [Ilex paraguariensis]|uniref:Uncharacterized protein n=1 Tax=Ilex paraguariensis TaxID=185542 RepID=A0ABC8SKL0_9AQUA